MSTSTATTITSTGIATVAGAIPIIANDYKYKHLAPVFNSTTYPPLTPYDDFVDAGSRALKHDDPRAFLRGTHTKVVELTPELGSEITGVDLVSLDNDERDQLALEVARRGVIVFRNQARFIDRAPSAYLEWGSHFGRLHIHPTSGHPEGYPELHLVFKDENQDFNFRHEDATTTTLWHTDVSYERQPPGLTTFFLVAAPSTGGDTLFVSGVSALKSLSKPYVDFLKTLKALHSGVEQAEFSRNKKKRGGVVRREPVEHVHPIVRKHPVTGEEALYINRQFTRKIVGLKKPESDSILEFLYQHIERSGDIQARVKWEPNTVVIWDNRTTAHSAVVDYAKSKERRHGVRITPQAEKPVPALDTLDLGDK